MPEISIMYTDNNFEVSHLDDNEDGSISVGKTMKHMEIIGKNCIIFGSKNSIIGLTSPDYPRFVMSEDKDWNIYIAKIDYYVEFDDLYRYVLDHESDIGTWAYSRWQKLKPQVKDDPNAYRKNTGKQDELYAGLVDAEKIYLDKRMYDCGMRYISGGKWTVPLPYNVVYNKCAYPYKVLSIIFWDHEGFREIDSKQATFMMYDESGDYKWTWWVLTVADVKEVFLNVFDRLKAHISGAEEDVDTNMTKLNDDIIDIYEQFFIMHEGILMDRGFLELDYLYSDNHYGKIFTEKVIDDTIRLIHEKYVKAYQERDIIPDTDEDIPDEDDGIPPEDLPDTDGDDTEEIPDKKEFPWKTVLIIGGIITGSLLAIGVIIALANKKNKNPVDNNPVTIPETVPKTVPETVPKTDSE
ncbi:MAG: hypothetical protein KAW47_05695 [Thermoplasmatales archaeon]|nr:hypothetical protein [Thermoplasmatales archaeon]